MKEFRRSEINFGAKQITGSPTDIEKSSEDTAKAVNDLENITFRRTNESDASAAVDDNIGVEYIKRR